MNARILVACSFASLASACGTLDAPDGDGDDVVVTTTVTTDDGDTATEADTDDESEETDEVSGAYSYEDGVLTIGHSFNPYKGERIGVFNDGGGVEDGWTTAVATIPATESGEVPVDLGLFGDGQSTRWALATLTDDNQPDNWLWESGVIAENLVNEDSLGLTLWVEECGVEKLNFCTRLVDSGVIPGQCSLTYVDPASCEDADADGDTDPDADGAGDEDADCADADGDGYTDAECGGTDCDDGWRYNYPGAPETNDDVDNDCDGSVDEDCESDDGWNETCD